MERKWKDYLCIDPAAFFVILQIGFLLVVQPVPGFGIDQVLVELGKTWKVFYNPDGGIGYSLKPISHCDAKLLSLGLRVGSAPKCENLHRRYQHVGI